MTAAMRFPYLFTPGRVGPLELGNRIVRSPLATLLGNADGTVSEPLIDFYRTTARGGAALVMVEYSYIDDLASRAAPCQLGISQDEHIPGLSRLASTIQENGALAGIQLAHCGRQKFLGRRPIKAASTKPWRELYQRTGIAPEALTADEIAQIVIAFGDAAARAAAAGFDLIEIHAAHGYLISNFLSRLTNDRDDPYGGSIESRMRLLREIARSVRARLPSALGLSVRLNGSDYLPGGVTIDEALAAAAMLDRLGVDVLNVSGGDHHAIDHEVAPMVMPHGLHIWAAAAIRECIARPVIAAGSIVQPEMAERVLAAGQADFVGLGRPLLADPRWPAKARAGAIQAITPCIRCNDGCLERTTNRFRSIRCSVNPEIGLEPEYQREPVSRLKRIAVIGGGPAGIMAAAAAASRSHDVTLFEERDLGGALVQGSRAEFKCDVHALLKHLVAQVGELGIPVVHERATAELVTKERFDVVVVATGAMPCRPKDHGDWTDVILAEDVLRSGDDEWKGVRAVVIGGGFVGIEAALYLAAAGAQVSVLERLKDFMRGDLATARRGYLNLAAHYGVALIASCQAIGAGAGTVTVRSGEETKQLAADRAVIAIGRQPNDWLLEALRAQPEVMVLAVGDCVHPARIHDAIHTGRHAGLRI